MLAEECCGDRQAEMPPITDDPGSFSANCSLMLNQLGSNAGSTSEKGRAEVQHRPIESDFSFLLAKVSHLGLNKEGVTAVTLRRILQARKDSEIKQYRKNFRDRVDSYVQQLPKAPTPEREMIGEHFARELNDNLAILQRELKRAGIEAICSKEGAVAVVTGMAAGVLNPGLGLAIGLSGGLLSYRKKRREVFQKNCASWAFSATASDV